MEVSLSTGTDEWVDDFLRLFCSCEKGDFGRALDLKNLHIPKKLYRYRPLNEDNLKFRFGEIIRGELFLEHPQNLNDPFELCSMINGHTPKEYLFPNAKEKFMESFANNMDAKDYARIFANSDWYDELSLYVAQKTVSPDRVQEVKDAFSKVYMLGVEIVTSKVNEVQRNTVRLACFSETSCNLPMWHHYTNGHRGICLEYDTQSITNALHFNSIFPVKYVERLPDAASMLTNGSYSPFTMEYMAMHKLKDWAYEHEWRLILHAGCWYWGSEGIPEDFWENGKLVQFIKPSKIIMGTRISEEHEAKMKEYAQIAGLPIVKAKQTEYGLIIE